jgi:hypothetical protein
MRMLIGLFYFCVFGASLTLNILSYFDIEGIAQFAGFAPLCACTLGPTYLALAFQWRGVKGTAFWQELLSPLPPIIQIAAMVLVAALFFSAAAGIITGVRSTSAQKLNGNYVVYSTSRGVKSYADPEVLPGNPTVYLNNVTVERTTRGRTTVFKEIDPSEYRHNENLWLRFITAGASITSLICALFFWFPRKSAQEIRDKWNPWGYEEI